MGILNIRKAKSGNAPTVIGICGAQGSGKTLTALKMARGMVDSSSEVGFLDTENGRGSHYADALDGEFLIADLYPPFTPRRYAEAIKEFQQAGVKVLVIDSVTHEYEGEGGIEDIANSAKENGKRMANWILAKQEHKKFMNTLLYSNMDIICCIRAREKTDFSIPDKPKSLGIQPICEKNFMFEMTVSFVLESEGRFKEWRKIPNFLKPVFANKTIFGEKEGLEIAKIMRAKKDPFDKYRSELLLASEKGLDATKAHYLQMPKDAQIALKSEWHVFESSAKEYDKQKEDSGVLNEVEEKKIRLSELFESVEDKLTQPEKDAIKKTLSENIVADYDKTLNFLKSK